ncbi:MAG: hypothetical protein ACPGJE_08170 [Wenzhouxiangellaceae bacterium]
MVGEVQHFGRQRREHHHRQAGDQPVGQQPDVDGQVAFAIADEPLLQRAVVEVGALVEGVPTSRAIAAMAKKCKVEMPIAEEVARLIDGRSAPLEAVQRLLAREPAVEGG